MGREPYGAPLRVRAMRRSNLGVAVAVLLALLTVTACGSDKPKAAPPSSTTATVPPTTTAAAAVSTTSTTGTSATATTVSGATAVRTFSPWSASGTLAPGLNVSSTLRGTCWTQSDAVGSATTYRCMAGNEIYDPCFTPPRQSNPADAACPLAPWDSTVTVLTLSGPLPTAGSTAYRFPWAIELSNQARCIVISGTSTSVDGVRLSYYCLSPRGAAAAIVSMTQPWGAKFATNPASGPLQSERVTLAWY